MIIMMNSHLIKDMAFAVRRTVAPLLIFPEAL